MEIDSQIEPLVREALDAAVKEDEDRLGAALSAFPDEYAGRKGLELTVAISYVALMDMYDGSPSDEELTQAATVLAELAQWAGVTAEDAHAYLATLRNAGSFRETFDSDTAVFLIFVITATMLAASPKVKEDEWWFNYLDRIEATIAAS